MSGPSSKPEPVFDDAIDAELQRKQKEAARREAARLRFRELFPKTTEFADEARKHFGDGVEILWTFENGQYVGNPPPEEIADYEERHGPVRRVRLFEPDHPHNGGAPSRKGP